ncbi:hypothetical protein BH11CYA1_BH11CYA1_48930 [soil metagenome]
MIEYASEILQQLLAASDQAFQEIIFPVAGGDVLDEDVQERAMQANSALPRGITRRDAPGTAAVGTIQQAVVVAMAIENTASDQSFRRVMAQISLELSNEVERLTDAERPEHYADCSSFIANDRFQVAILVATAHIVGTAARRFATCDAEALELFITAELEVGNAFMLSDLQAIRSAARECGID